MNKTYLFIALRVLVVIAAFILGIIAIFFIGKLTVPFIIGFFLALLINPLVELIQRKTKMPRGFAVLSSILIILAVISTAVTLLVNEIIQGFSYLSNVVPEHYNSFTIYMEKIYLERIFPIYNNLLHLFQDLDQSQRSTILESMQFAGEKLTNAFSAIVQALGNGLYFIISKLPSFATTLIISLLATFFISKDWYHIVKRLHNKIPATVQTRINQIYEGLQRTLLGFLKAEFKLTFISAVIVFIGLLVLRVEHALSIALIIWIVDFLPYLGAIILFLPWVIYCFSTGDIFLGTGLSILYGLIVLQRQLIKPKILSSSIGISPLLTLLTMYVGFKLIGVIGIILGPLTFILMKILHETGIFHDIWIFILGKKKITLLKKK
ncbi:sporulation integral membrane protein YtvI [Pseudogracilibacillus sp. SE30717A]|uniref:sporulation integral membrane protein YtvI n=1 Tax=Pseudogracilibacillus sp. SE30717A TaxID=3098293 RepID=UPI00300E51F5